MIFTSFETALVGLPVSHVWRGYGSALFVEFGVLTTSSHVRRDGSNRHPTGEITLMIEWSWRIENPRSILGGSWSDERKWPAMFSKLQEGRVLGVKTFGKLPEIEVTLTNGVRLASFMTAEGQPEWCLICRGNKGRILSVRRGKLFVQELPTEAGAP